MTVRRTHAGHPTRYEPRDGVALVCTLTFGEAEIEPTAWKILLPRPGERSEPFTYGHPRLAPDREGLIRKTAAGADPRGGQLPARMTQSLLAEVDALRSGQ